MCWKVRPPLQMVEYLYWSQKLQILYQTHHICSNRNFIQNGFANLSHHWYQLGDHSQFSARNLGKYAVNSVNRNLITERHSVCKSFILDRFSCHNQLLRYYNTPMATSSWSKVYEERIGKKIKRDLFWSHHWESYNSIIVQWM